MEHEASAGWTAVASVTLGTRSGLTGKGSSGGCRVDYGPPVVMAPVIIASMAACG